MATLEMNPGGCVVEPSQVDWREQGDDTVVAAAQAGIQEAEAERKRRGLPLS